MDPAHFAAGWIRFRVDGLWVQASAVIDRIRRAIAAASDSVSQRIGPIATLLGRAFGVDDW